MGLIDFVSVVHDIYPDTGLASLAQLSSNSPIVY